jgi:hypothetical protein
MPDAKNSREKIIRSNKKNVTGSAHPVLRKQIKVQKNNKPNETITKNQEAEQKPTIEISPGLALRGRR